MEPEAQLVEAGDELFVEVDAVKKEPEAQLVEAGDELFVEVDVVKKRKKKRRARAAVPCEPRDDSGHGSSKVPMRN